VAKYPTAKYEGTFAGFEGDAPTRIDGNLTIRGVTRPVSLAIGQFKCMPHPMLRREVCGADASANIDRSDFGIDMGRDFGFKMDVKLQIQVEGIREN
ncbi:MAG: YceI family protein, partial [Gammaproteobacteria bacterium]